MCSHDGYGTGFSKGVPHLRLLMAFLVAFAMGLAMPLAARADEVDGSIQVVQEEPAIEALDDSDGDGYPLPLTTQDTNDVIAQYPEAADAMLKCFVLRDAGPIDLSSTDLDFTSVRNLVDAILGQHPELIDVSKDYDNRNNQFTPHYLFKDRNVDEIMAMRQKMARGIAHAMSWIPENGTDLQKVKAAHDFLVAHVLNDTATLAVHGSYGSLASDGGGVYGRIITNGVEGRFYPYCAYGPIVEHSGVFEGISYAFKLLMDKCGIPCEYVFNSVDRYGWNHVMVGDAWYNVDVTNDLAQEANKTLYSAVSPQYWVRWSRDYISYDYFLKSDPRFVELDQRVRERTHVNYHDKNSFIHTYATSTSYDNVDDSVWQSTQPFPNTETIYCTKSQVTQFDISTTALDLEVGKSHRLTVSNVLPEELSPLMARWTSSDPSVAYVCADGTVVGIGDGTATITCTMGDKDMVCNADRTNEVVRTCEVTVGDAVAAEPAFTSAQLLLGEQLKMVFWLTVPEGVDVTGGTAEFAIGGKNARTTSVDLAGAIFDEGQNRYGFPFELSSVEMAQEITCTFSSGGEEKDSREYSVKEYVQAAVVSDRLSEAERDCARAVANYGHYMQRYLSQKTDPGWTIGQDYEEMDVFYEGANDVNTAKQAVQQYAPVKTGPVKAGCSLTLDSYTTLDLSIYPEGAQLGATGTFGGSTYTAVEQGDRYRIRVGRVKAADLATTLEVTGQKDGEDFTIVAQPLSYAYIVLNGSQDQTANEAMASLYYYYATAAALKGSTS